MTDHHDTAPQVTDQQIAEHLAIPGYARPTLCRAAAAAAGNLSPELAWLILDTHTSIGDVVIDVDDDIAFAAAAARARRRHHALGGATHLATMGHAAGYIDMILLHWQSPPRLFAMDQAWLEARPAAPRTSPSPVTVTVAWCNRGVSFAATQYDAEVARMAADHSWETPERAAGRLTLTNIDRERLLTYGLRPRWVANNHRDPELFRVAFQIEDDYQVFVDTPRRGRSPEELAHAVCATWHVRHIHGTPSSPRWATLPRSRGGPGHARVSSDSRLGRSRTRTVRA